MELCSLNQAYSTVNTVMKDPEMVLYVYRAFLGYGVLSPQPCSAKLQSPVLEDALAASCVLM